jgi:DNA-binding GntR family transcriptional regulator
MSEPLVLSENAIYERMIAAIMDHRLAPGTKLVEDKLANAFGVSRTRIRPVLVRLANEHIVTLSPNRGAAVTRPTEVEAAEVFEVRRLIEPLLVQRFVSHASEDDVAAVTQVLAQEEAATARGDARSAIRLSGEFHLRIAQGAAHGTMARILREMVSRTSLILMTYGRSSNANGHPSAHAQHHSHCGCSEHHALMQAMAQRRGDRAATLMTEHLAHIQSQVVFTPPESDTPDLLHLFGAVAVG